MTRVALANLLAAAAAVTASTLVGTCPAPIARAPSRAAAAADEHETAPLRDHSGALLPAGPYARIVSVSSLGDELLLALCEPDRVVAFTAYSAGHAFDGYRFGGKPTVDLGHLERILDLHPDLVLVSALGDPRPVARLREAGLAVYDLGPMRGMATLLPNIHEVAAVLGHRERGERLARTLADRMATIAADVPADARRRGLYLSLYGGRLFGGAAGTSFHDVLLAAGLLEAADGYVDWPEYTTEQVLAMDPEILVTRRGMDATLCAHSGFARLRACSGRGRVVGLDPKLLDDPGPSMADAASLLRDEVYGPPAAR